MRLRSLLAGAAIAGTLGIGTIAMTAGTASASVVDQQPSSNFCPLTSHGDCGQQPKCETGGQLGFQADAQYDNRNSSCCDEEITFSFAPSRGRHEGTWLLEVSGPPLYNGEVITYDGTPWVVEGWEAHGNGTLGFGKPYFTLFQGWKELTGGFWENPQTAWIDKDCVVSTNPCDPHGFTTESYSSYGGYGNDNSKCDPCGNQHPGFTTDSQGILGGDNHGQPSCTPCPPPVRIVTDPCPPVTAPCKPPVRVTSDPCAPLGGKHHLHGIV
jgi:hypothetical protein